MQVRDIAHHTPDAIAALSVPVNIALWVADLDFVLRLLVSVGSLVLIALAIKAKLAQGRKRRGKA